MRFLLLVGAALGALAAPAAAAQGDGSARDVVQTAERAISDDSSATVNAQWIEAIRRDSTDRVASLGLASLARLTASGASNPRRR
jgi:hypothetical protein